RIRSRSPQCHSHHTGRGLHVRSANPLMARHVRLSRAVLPSHIANCVNLIVVCSDSHTFDVEGLTETWLPGIVMRIRSMRPDEISIAVDWAAAEGWNPGLADATCFSSVDPDGFLIGELDGAPAATISCVNYGASFAFLGFYIVRKD